MSARNRPMQADHQDVRKTSSDVSTTARQDPLESPKHQARRAFSPLRTAPQRSLSMSVRGACSCRCWGQQRRAVLGDFGARIVREPVVLARHGGLGSLPASGTTLGARSTSTAIGVPVSSTGRQDDLRTVSAPEQHQSNTDVRSPRHTPRASTQVVRPRRRHGARPACRALSRRARKPGRSQRARPVYRPTQPSPLDARRPGPPRTRLTLPRRRWRIRLHTGAWPAHRIVVRRSG